MKKKRWRIFFFFVLISGNILFNESFSLARQKVTSLELAKTMAAAAVIQEFHLPLYFIPNLGQLDHKVNFYLQGKDKNIYFNSEGLTIALIKGRYTAASWTRWVIKLEFVAANRNVRPEGQLKNETKVSYFKGQPENWLTDLPTYSRIAYHELWPGVDLVFSGDESQLKYEFKVNPGADPANIKLAYRGASRVFLNDQGQLEIQTPAGNFVDQAPVAYQLVDGKKIYIPVKFKILEEKKIEANSLVSTVHTFQIGDYDRGRPLYIDPAVLIYSGYLGGSSNDRALALAIDASGNAYLAGWTASYDFPTAVGPDPTFNGPALGTDAFVAKVNASGTGLIFCGYLGGSYDDAGTGLAVDSSGNVYVCGYTRSPDFPVLVGPYTSYQGNITQYSEAFITKIDASGSHLIYSGFIGGTYADQALAVAVDNLGRAYLCGTTESSDFPTKTGPDLSYNGLKDVFVLRVAASGSNLDWSGFIGGTNDDIGSSIAIDSSGNVYVAGYTASTPAQHFPVKIGPKLTHSGGLDAFVAKVDKSGSTLVYCGYIGGNSDDYGTAVAIDSAGNAYLTGTTISASGFPVKVGPDLSYNGGADAFVAKVGATGSDLVFCGYLGGSADDFGLAIAVDTSGNVYIAGATDSSDFPVTGNLYPYRGNRDAFVSVLKADGQSYYFSTFLGGSDREEANAVASDGDGNIYVAGFTRSPDFPVVNGPFLMPGGGIGYQIEDAFVSRIYGLPPAAPANLRLVSVTDTEANLAWDDRSKNETGFKIERKKGTTGTWSQIATVAANVTTYRDSGLNEATGYYYRVSAFNDYGTSGYSNELNVLTRPAAPGNLVATAIHERQVNLSWTDNSAGESGFRIERKTGSGSWVQLTTLAANVTSYSDTSVVETTTYTYRVFAFNDSGDSTASNEATVTTPALTIPLAPGNLQAQAISAIRVNLTWTDNSYNEDGFKIERKTGASGTWSQIGVSSANSTSYLDTTVSQLTTYYYRVRAFNNAGDSDYSNEASVTTPENKPKLRLPISDVAFGNVNVCSFADKTTTLYNDGGGELVVSGVFKSSGADDFSYSGPAVPFTVPPFSSKTITIRFSPQAVGAASASFTVSSNDPDNPAATFGVSGNGFIPVITINLEVERLTERAWIIRRDYGRLTIVVNKEAPYQVAKYRLWRKVTGGSYELRKEFSEAEFSYDRLVYIDKYLDKGKNYLYRVEALDCHDRVIASSEEKSTVSPQIMKKNLFHKPGKLGN